MQERQERLNERKIAQEHKRYLEVRAQVLSLATD